VLQLPKICGVKNGVSDHEATTRVLKLLKILEIYAKRTTANSNKREEKSRKRERGSKALQKE
jgi:hypothetical protein